MGSHTLRLWGALAAIVTLALGTAAELQAEGVDQPGFPTAAYRLPELLGLKEPIGGEGLVQIVQAFRYCRGTLGPASCKAYFCSLNFQVAPVNTSSSSFVVAGMQRSSIRAPLLLVQIICINTICLPIETSLTTMYRVSVITC